MKTTSIILVFTGLSVAGLFFYFYGPGGTGTIGNYTTNDGTIIKVIQTHNQSLGEPYTIDFYLKRPGESWGWCYIDHQDTRWTRARLVPTPDGQSVKIFRGATLRAEYFIGRKTLALYGKLERELPAPQEFRDPSE